ncbi:hypothetical protein ILUMI_19171 [Ignelater luminosus]|uniref:Uncharacterized protein n=1 Tax=Ignelater luminosus TaxID=2038154 RepID=A0A8K0CMW3_IGNLU|nr:hypothetical protein ILUMI_19171 [Ignelater luminosus]
MKYCAFLLVLVVVLGVMSQVEAQTPTTSCPGRPAALNAGSQFAKIHPGKQAAARKLLFILPGFTFIKLTI